MYLLSLFDQFDVSFLNKSINFFKKKHLTWLSDNSVWIYIILNVHDNETSCLYPQWTEWFGDLVSAGKSAHNPLFLWCCQVRPLNKKTYTIFPVLIGYSLTQEDTLSSECCRMRDSSTICQIKFLSKKLEISPFQVQDQNVELDYWVCFHW